MPFHAIIPHILYHKFIAYKHLFVVSKRILIVILDTCTMLGSIRKLDEEKSQKERRDTEERTSSYRKVCVNI